MTFFDYKHFLVSNLWHAVCPYMCAAACCGAIWPALIDALLPECPLSLAGYNGCSEVATSLMSS